jgi:hypothetical protein
MEMRCGHKLHGVISGDYLEVKCSSSFCGAKPGVVVIHRFNSKSGDLVDTKQYRDTPIVKQERH